MNARHLEILQHALGLDQYGLGTEYRNRFVTGLGSRDFDDCQALTTQGLMQDHGVHALSGGSHLFTVTEAGREYVREHSPRPPKLTRGQRPYREYLAGDGNMSFGEWLRGVQ